LALPEHSLFIISFFWGFSSALLGYSDIALNNTS